MKDVVIVDNSVYSFAFQIDNGIPIIPFYNDKADEEMLHLVYYLNCLAGVDDVRDQNRQALCDVICTELSDIHHRRHRRYENCDGQRS